MTTTVSNGVTSDVTTNLSGAGSSFTILSGGTVNVQQGGVTSGDIVSGGVENVSSGGVGSYITVSNGGAVNVSAGGQTSYVTVSAGGAANVLSGGAESFATVSGGSEYVSSGGTAISTTLVDSVGYFGGGEQTVYAGGLAIGAIVEAALGEQVVYGVASDTVVLASDGSEGEMVVEFGGSAVSATDQGYTIVSSGGVAIDTVVAGDLDVSSGGIAINPFLTSGGYATVYSGGILEGATVGGISGGELFVSAGAVVTGTIVVSSGAEIAAYKANGSATSLTISSGAAIEFLSGATSGGPYVSVTIGTGGILEFGSGYSEQGNTVSSGTILKVFSGGTASASTIKTGGLAIIASGGTAHGLKLSGTLIVEPGAVVSTTSSGTGAKIISSGVALLSGATLLSSGATLTGKAIGGGELEYVLSGGTDTGATLTGGGSQVVFGMAVSATLDGGDVQTVSSGGKASGTVISATDSQVVASGGIASNTVISGGTMDVQSGGAATGAITFSGTGGLLQIDGTSLPTDPSQVLAATISGFASGDTIDLTGIASAAGAQATLGAGNLLQISDGGHTYDLQLDPSQNYTGDYFHLASDGASGADITENNTPCFVRGARILTPNGEVPVEDLRAGDLVTVLDGSAKPILWIGVGRSLVTPANPSARPVIVRKSALTDGVPHRDLFLTSLHALYLDEVLIPVEHLINGHSILWDARARVVEFFHVELARHDVLIAEGAPAESYMDNGNRSAFLNPERPDGWAPSDWFAPLVTGGPVVERAWSALLDRSGFVPPPLTQDPDLHVLADGVRINGKRGDAGPYRFRLSRPPLDLRIVSRSVIPRLIGRNYDHRRLGVALRSVTLRGEGYCATIGFDSPLLGVGFHFPELEWSLRWTTGNAVIPGRAFIPIDGSLELELDVVGTVAYPAPMREDRSTEATPASTYGHLAP